MRRFVAIILLCTVLTLSITVKPQKADAAFQWAALAPVAVSLPGLGHAALLVAVVAAGVYVGLNLDEILDAISADDGTGSTTATYQKITEYYETLPEATKLELQQAGQAIKYDDASYVPVTPKIHEAAVQFMNQYLVKKYKIPQNFQIPNFADGISRDEAINYAPFRIDVSNMENNLLFVYKQTAEVTYFVEFALKNYVGGTWSINDFDFLATNGKYIVPTIKQGTKNQMYLKERIPGVSDWLIYETTSTLTRDTIFNGLKSFENFFKSQANVSNLKYEQVFQHVFPEIAIPVPDTTVYVPPRSITQAQTGAGVVVTIPDTVITEVRPVSQPIENADPVTKTWLESILTPIADFFQDGIVGDMSKINFDALKSIPATVTTKFPFSLPWDIGRALDAVFGQFADSNTPPSWIFNLDVAGKTYSWVIQIPQIIHNWMPFARWVILITFDIALVFAVRKLLGGAQ